MGRVCKYPSSSNVAKGLENYLIAIWGGGAFNDYVERILPFLFPLSPLRSRLLNAPATLNLFGFGFVMFSSRGYKIGNVFDKKSSTYLKDIIEF